MGNILEPISEGEAYEYVYAQARYTNGLVSVYIPDTPFLKLKPGLELKKKKKVSSSKKKSKHVVTDEDAESNLERSLRRTKSKIKDITTCNDFELFVTFTFNCRSCESGCKNNPCICDEKCLRLQPGYCKGVLQNWLKNEQHRKGKFDYLIVAEYHKKDNALHFHSLINGYKGEVRQSFWPDGTPKKDKKGRLLYHLPSFTSGFTDVKKVDNSVGSIAKVGFYLLKYITKDMPILFGKNRYRVSHGLKRAKLQDNPEPWYKIVKPARDYDVKNGKVFEFPEGSSTLVDMFIEANQP